MKVRTRGIFRNIYELNDWVYTITGWGIIESPVMWHQILYHTYNIISMMSYCLHILFTYVEFMSVLDDTPKACYVLTYSITMTMGVSRSYFLHYKLKALKELGSKLDNNFNFSWAETRKWDLIKRKNRRVMVYVSVGYYAAVSITWTVFVISALAGITGWFFILPLPRRPSLERMPWFYISTSLIQCIFGYGYVLHFLAHELLLYGFILRLGEHLDIIENRLKAVRCRLPQRDYAKFVRGYSDYPDDGDCVFERQLLTPEKIHIVIVQCIKHHQAINESLNIMQTVYNRSFVLTTYLGACILALVISTLFSDKTSKAILVQQLMFALIAMSTLFSYCNLGTQLTEKFENVRFAFYSCPWYELGGNSRRMLTFVLLRLQSPGKLRAGNLVDVSLETYLRIMKFSYNLVTFLQNK